MATKRFLPCAALALAACAPTPTQTPPAIPESGPAPSAPAPVVTVPTPTYKPLSPLDQYKQRVAQRIVQANGAHVFEGVPPHFLKSITVVTFTVDAKGNLTGSRVLRGNGHRSLEQLALTSVKRAAPFDAPPRTVMRGSVVEVTETWLFRDDGKFQIRSIAAEQPAAEPEPDKPPRRRG